MLTGSGFGAGTTTGCGSETCGSGCNSGLGLKTSSGCLANSTVSSVFFVSIGCVIAGSTIGSALLVFLKGLKKNHNKPKINNKNKTNIKVYHHRQKPFGATIGGSGNTISSKVSIITGSLLIT